jgi:hypothetical protein
VVPARITLEETASMFLTNRENTAIAAATPRITGRSRNN